MTYNPEIHHRQSIRLKEHDYSQAGAYFVTVCAWKKECLFGEVRNGEMLLNEYGEIIIRCRDDLPNYYPNVQLDEFIVMPNHIHGIVSLSNVGAQFIAPFIKTTTEKQGVMNEGLMNQAPTENNRSKQGAINHLMNLTPTENNGAIKQGAINHAPTVGEIVRAFKARCTHAINKIRNTPGVPVWQHNYYEHIIRDERELYAIRQYLRYNPLKWDEDEENIDETGRDKSRPYA